MSLLTKKQLERKIINEYKKQLTEFILTSRFNLETWEENKMYRKKKNIKCIYCAPDPISLKIPLETELYVLEMNNTENRIMGIGLIKNHPIVSKYRVYNTFNYNRYVYVGKTRIDRSEMDDYEEQIMRAFDILCFTGNKHMKRGQGLKCFPIEMIYKILKCIDLIDFIKTMFKKRIK